MASFWRLLCLDLEGAHTLVCSRRIDDVFKVGDRSLLAAKSWSSELRNRRIPISKHGGAACAGQRDVQRSRYQEHKDSTTSLQIYRSRVTLGKRQEAIVYLALRCCSLEPRSALLRNMLAALARVSFEPPVKTTELALRAMNIRPQPLYLCRNYPSYCISYLQTLVNRSPALSISITLWLPAGQQPNHSLHRIHHTPLS